MTDQDPVTAHGTRMFAEAAVAGRAVERQLTRNRALIKSLGQTLRALHPRAVVTCARGSSDHAATFAKYLIETRTGILTASAAPSISSIYGARQDLEGCVFLVLSQSGRSPDLLASTRAAAEAGALVVALVNDEHSPLAEDAHHTIPLCAGAETSVAATKSYITTLAAVVDLVAAWVEDGELAQALAAAPELLEQSWGLSWDAALPVLTGAQHLYVVGRGIGLGIAQEAALKCKETCALHAEAFSSAEIQHGPQALLNADFPALLFAQNDETLAGMQSLAAQLVERGVTVLAAGLNAAPGILLPTASAHPAIEPMLRIQSFYRLANALARARGLDPDTPPHLSKVTRTL